MRTLLKVVAVLLCYTSSLAFAFGNEDVVKLLKADMPEEVIVAAIAGASQATFDTSTDGLVALKQAGASDVVLQKIIQRKLQPTQTATIAPATNDRSCKLEGTGEKDLQYLRSGGKVIALQYQVPELEMKWDAGSLGSTLLSSMFGTNVSAKSVYRIKSTKAEIRITEPFEFVDVLLFAGVAPENVLKNAVSLVRMQGEEQSRTMPMDNTLIETNEIKVVNENARLRLVPEKVATTCRFNGTDVVQYRLKPVEPVGKGEFALVVTQDLKNYKVYDFGVD